MDQYEQGRSWGKPVSNLEDQEALRDQDSGCCVALAILSVIAINFMLFTIPFTLMPLLAQERGVSSAIVGIIFAAWGFPSLFNSLYPSFERCCKTKPLLLCNILSINLAFGLMGLCQYFQNRQLFIAWAFFTRLIQGVNSTFLKLMTLIISKRLFHSHFAILVELRSAVTLLFLGIGPLFSAELGALFSFDIVLYIGAALGLGAVLPFVWKVLPAAKSQFSAAKIAAHPSQKQDLQRGRLVDKSETLMLYKLKGIKYCLLLKQPLFIATMLSCFHSIFSELFYTPFFALKLKNDFHIPSSSHGYFFLVRAICGMLAATPGVFLLRRCMRFSSIIALGNIIALISHVLMSLSPMIRIPHSIGFVWIGIMLNGLSYSLTHSPLVPYLIDFYERHQVTQSIKGNQYQAQLTAKVMPLYALVCGISEMISPPIGGLIYEQIGYSHTFEVAILVSFIVAGMWLIFGHVFDRKEYRHFKKVMKDRKDERIASARNLKSEKT